MKTDLAEERLGDWMQTAHGRKFWPMDPRPEEVHIDDVAHALSMICRFGGHCLRFYSVAQHSVLVARALPAQFRRWGLMHDASEAYVIDVPRPLKYWLEGYKRIENRVTDAVAIRFGLPLTPPPEVKIVDMRILGDEAAQLMAPPPEPWTLPHPPLGIEIEPWSPERAKREFLNEFRSLFPEC